MRACEGCGLDVNQDDGVTVVPALSGNTDNSEWWHPECRQAELRQRVAAATPSTGRPKATTKPRGAIVATVDDDPEV